MPLLEVGMNPCLRVCCDCWMGIQRVQIIRGCQVGMIALPSWSCAPARAPASALAPCRVTPPCDVASLSLSCRGSSPSDGFDARCCLSTLSSSLSPSAEIKFHHQVVKNTCARVTLTVNSHQKWHHTHECRTGEQKQRRYDKRDCVEDHKPE